jgi:hypothetical protein
LGFTLKSSVQFHCLGNVLGLARFRTSGKQQQEFIASDAVVHPVARPHINLQFRHSLGEIAVIARVAVNEAVDLRTFMASL